MPDTLPVPTRLRPTITAAAQRYTPQEYRAGTIHHGPWQREAWYYYDTLGEFAQAVDWQARGMSRILLGAGEVTPEGVKPVTEGPAAQLMASFAGGTPGHAAFLAAITPHLLVPGEGWLIAERTSPLIPLALADWTVYAADMLLTYGTVWRVQVGDSQWRDLAPDNLPMRIFQPHPRRPWLARSSAEAAIPIMRRIELIDKRIIAMMVSRLAMNGLLLIPQEGTFSVPPQYADAPDPFVAMLIDIAGKNIAEPGRASAGIPIPVKFTSELIDKWRLLKPEDPLDEWLLKERTDELGRLGDALSIARERVSGGLATDSNHWNLWGLSEEEIRLTFSPMAETICGAVTKTFLRPALLLSGEPLVGPNGGALVAWYDPVKLAARSDLSAAAMNLYDRGALSATALRRESGFDESDAQDPAERDEWVWIQLLKDPNLAPTAVQKLTGLTVTAPPAAPVAGGTGGTTAGPVGAAPASPATGPPGTGLPAPTVPAIASAAALRVPVRVSTAVEANGHGRR